MFRLKEDTICYQNNAYQRDRLLWNLYSNAFRTIKSVYLFKNFAEYVRQLKSDKQKDKEEVYWNASYDEKLIDYIKISVAFETFNKATLLQKGIVVHRIDPKFNRELAKRQRAGLPVSLVTFLKGNHSIIDFHTKKSELNGFLANYPTIGYAQTLNEYYQEYIGLDDQFIFELKDINQRRNKLHFYTDFRGGFMVDRHIQKWRYIMEKSEGILEYQLRVAMEELKTHN